jgi:hypothetical protein
MSCIKGSKKTGGRKKGTPNKPTAGVRAILDELKYDPVREMVRIANLATKKGDHALAGSMAKEVAQYIYPKRKQVEHLGEDGRKLFPTIEIHVTRDPEPMTLSGDFIEG